MLGTFVVEREREGERDKIKKTFGKNTCALANR